MRRGGKAAGGFTLIELVVVVTIMGLLIGMGVPKVSLAVEESRVESAKNGLYQLWTAQRLYRMETGRFAATVADLRDAKVVPLGFTNTTEPFVYSVVSASANAFRLRARRTGGDWRGSLILRQNGRLTGNTRHDSGWTAYP